MSDRFGVSYTAAARQALEIDLPEDTSAAALEFIDGVLRDHPKTAGEPVSAGVAAEYGARVGDYWVTYRVEDETDAAAIPRAGRVPSDPSPIIRRETGAIPIARRSTAAPLLVDTVPPLLADTVPPLPTQHRASAEPLDLAETTRAVDRWFEAHGSASLWVVPVMVLAAVVTGLAIANAAPTAGESALTGLVWDLVSSGRLATPSSWWQQSPLGWLQLAAWVQATGAFDRWGLALLAVREAMIPVAAATSGLVWVLGRRLGLGRIAATVAAVVVAVSPTALAVHTVAATADVGAMWLLLALVVATIRRPPIAVGVVVGFAAALAVLSAQPTVAALPVVGWLLARSAGREARIGAVAAAAISGVLAVVFAQLVLVAASTGEQPAVAAGAASGFALWWQTDPALVVLAALAGAYALLDARLRPIAVLAVGGLAALAVPGLVPAATVAAVLPCAAIVIVGVADEAIRTIRRRSAPRRIEPVAVLAVVGVAAVVVVSSAIARVPAAFTPAPADPGQQAEAWLAGNVAAGTPVLVDSALRVDLLRAGWGRDDIRTYDATAGDLPQRWTDASWAVVPDRLAEAAAGDSLVAATFDGLTVRRVLPGGVETAQAADAARGALRSQLGAQLALNPALVVSQSDRDLLAAGRVDDRIVSVLGALTGFGPVEVTGFPVVAGEEDAPRRQVAISSAYGRTLVDGGDLTATARALVVGLLDQYAPAASSVSGGSLLLRYAPTLGDPAG